MKIEDDYGAAPVLLHLRPFTEEDARAFLSEEFPEIDSTEVLAHLARCGIESLYENPLTLQMLGEVAQDDGPPPETRAQLFGRACCIMLKEANPRHHQDPHVRRSEGELLLGAGALCAAQLLCDRLGIFDGPNMETPEGYLNAGDMEELPFGGAVNDALRVRLFQSEAENLFTHIHRVIAEYLGAKWLAYCFETNVSEKRIFALFRQGEGVPTSLRGLHAWMAHFNETLARRCIEADPYAVLRYGDAETLSLDRARALLSALKGLSEDDPYFRAEDWGRHPVSGLMRPELREEVLAIVETADRHTHLRDLLLEAMAGTSLATELLPTLESIVFDRNRHVGERSVAAEALHKAAIRDDWEPVIDRLLGMNDPQSARIAFEFLSRAGLSGVPEATSVRTVLAYLGISPRRTSEDELLGPWYVPDDLFSDLDTARMASWLDALVESVRPPMEDAEFEAEWQVSSLVRRVAVRVLEAEPAIPVERVWSWIGWLDGHRGSDDDTDKRLVAVFRDNRPLRAAVMEHVLLHPCVDNTYMAGFRLARLRLGLHPTVEDLVSVLRALKERAADGPIDPETYRDLLSLGGTGEDFPSELRDAALEIANGDSALLSMVDRVSNPPEPEWEIEEVRYQLKREAERQRMFQSRRDALAERTEEIAAGDIGVLAEPANVYLGRRRIRVRQHPSDSEPSTEDRMRAFLGEELAERVMAGFIAALGRDDLPTASSIADVHSRGKHWPAEAVMICGVEELLRREQPIRAIGRNTLAAIYMASQRAPATGRRDGIDIGCSARTGAVRERRRLGRPFPDEHRAPTGRRSCPCRPSCAA